MKKSLTNQQELKNRQYSTHLLIRTSGAESSSQVKSFVCISSPENGLYV